MMLVWAKRAIRLSLSKFTQWASGLRHKLLRLTSKTALRILHFLRDLSCLRFTPAKALEFIEWQKTPTARETGDLVYVTRKALQQQKQDQGVSDQEYAAFVNQELARSQPVHLEFRPHLQITFNTPTNIRELTLDTAGDASIILPNLKLDHLVINSAMRELHIRDCFIRELTIRVSHFQRLIIERCWIGEFILHERIQHFEARRSGIVRVRPGGDSFAGPVIVHKLWLPRRHGLGGARAHEFRVVRKNLAELGALPAAGTFHAAELALDRRHDSFLTKLFSWFYEVIADFGNSAGRPLIWFGLCGLLASATAYLFGAVEVAEPKQLVAWQKDLEHQAMRAAAYPFISVFNPLGIFGKPLLVPTHWLWATWFGMLGLISAASLFFFFLALRRRFRLSD